MGFGNSGEKIRKKPTCSKIVSLDKSVRTPPQTAPDVELVWRDKKALKNREIADFRLIDRIRIPFDSSSETPRSVNLPQEKWTNKLISGDNLLVMSSLLKGRMKQEIEAVGGIKLIYIDPPFLVGADYKMGLLVGEDSQDRLNVIQEFAYRDSWKAGPSEYLNMMYDRLWLIKDLLADDGSVWVHCDWKANFMLRAILDEVFGAEAFRNEIIWYYTNKIPDTRKRQYTNATDTIFYYCKSPKSVFNWQFEKRDKPIRVSRMTKVDGKKIYPKGPDGKCLYVTREERTADNVWKFPLLHAHPEMWGYPTQKPMRLLERIILTGTNEGDLVADFFCGSGASLEVAQRLGRKWIGCDLGKIAIHTCRKRMIKALKEEEKKADEPFVGFDILETRASLKDLNLEKAVDPFPSKDFPRNESNIIGNFAYFRVGISIHDLTVSVTLTDFGLLSDGAEAELLKLNGKINSSRVILDNGKLIKVVNKRNGSEQRYLLTKKWSDWIDYWAVDFEYGSNQSNQDLDNRTDETVFNSIWHSFRTPKKRAIEFTSAVWTYNHPGNYKIAVKVIDIFGNETFKIFDSAVC